MDFFYISSEQITSGFVQVQNIQEFQFLIWVSFILNTFTNEFKVTEVPFIWGKVFIFKCQPICISLIDKKQFYWENIFQCEMLCIMFKNIASFSFLTLILALFGSRCSPILAYRSESSESGSSNFVICISKFNRNIFSFFMTFYFCFLANSEKQIWKCWKVCSFRSVSE